VLSALGVDGMRSRRSPALIQGALTMTRRRTTIRQASRVVSICQSDGGHFSDVPGPELSPFVKQLRSRFRMLHSAWANLCGSGNFSSRTKAAGQQNSGDRPGCKFRQPGAHGHVEAMPVCCALPPSPSVVLWNSASLS